MQQSAAAERLFEIALSLFRERGFANVSLNDIAASAGCAQDELFRHFPRKEGFVLRLYEGLANELEQEAGCLPAGTIQTRFNTILQAKLALSQPHREWLKMLLPAMLDPADRLGVLGPRVDRIRARVQGIFDLVVFGASDAPSPEQCPRIARSLYAAHLACVFLALQDQTPEGRLATDGAELATEIVGVMGPLLSRGQPGFFGRLIGRLLGLPRLDLNEERLHRVVSRFVQPPHDPAHFTLVETLLRDLFRHRRLQPGAGVCATNPCPQCLALHLPRVRAFVEAQQPLRLVLPAFPAKSANLRKVTGPLPDFGEELALRFLQECCDSIRERYAPGATVTICSDGRVFNDLVGVTDEAVTAYRARLIEMIRHLGLTSIEVFDLDDIRPGADFEATRQWLTEHYAESRVNLEDRTRTFEPHRQLFNGIHRFLREDLADREPELSQTQVRNRSKEQAYEVIRRSNAWSRLISNYFPDALRLSIHPQAPHSEKIGILLTPSDDAWLTPWHGVVLLDADRFVLTRRAEAELQGATLVYREGMPSHFERTTG